MPTRPSAAQPEGMGAGAPGGPEQAGAAGGARRGGERRSEGDARRGMRGNGSAGRERITAVIRAGPVINEISTLDQTTRRGQNE